MWLAELRLDTDTIAKADRQQQDPPHLARMLACHTGQRCTGQQFESPSQQLLWFTDVPKGSSLWWTAIEKAWVQDTFHKEKALSAAGF